MYEVQLAPDAQDFYQRADRPLAKKLARCFEQLERDPLQHPNIRRLTGPLTGHYRYRVGDHRVVYRVEPGNRVVVVLVIVHRSDAYS